MRIIAGEFRGRKLKSLEGTTVRPTADRLRETLFDILGPGIREAAVLDVFAGTGAIGLEAISRGAREVVFIESSADCIRLIRQNLALCGVKQGYRFIQQDVFFALRLLAREKFLPDVAFLDPPYNWKPYGDLLKTYFNLGLAHAATKVVIEHDRWSVLPEFGERFQATRVVRQSNHCLSFYSIANCEL